MLLNCRSGNSGLFHNRCVQALAFALLVAIAGSLLTIASLYIYTSASPPSSTAEVSNTSATGVNFSDTDVNPSAADVNPGGIPYKHSTIPAPTRPANSSNYTTTKSPITISHTTLSSTISPPTTTEGILLSIVYQI